MTGPGRRFDPAELLAESGAAPSDAEMADALAAARELESLSIRDQVGPTVGFEDRVMAAIAAEAPPRLVVRPTRAGLVGRAAAVAVSVGAAWRVATSGGRPVLVRAQAFAFVLLIVLATGSLAGVAAIGAANVLSPLTAPAPSVITNGPSTPPVQPTPVPPSALPAPSQSPESSPEPSPSDEPGATDDHGSGPGDNAGPTETPETKTPRPTRTPRPTETPRPTRTPRPTETPEGTDDHGGGGDDHSGSGGGGGDDGSGGGSSDDGGSGSGGD